MSAAVNLAPPQAVLPNDRHAIVVGTCSRRPFFQEAFRLALAALTEQSARSVLGVGVDAEPTPAIFEGAERDLVERARLYLDRAAAKLEIYCIATDSLEELTAAMREILPDMTSDRICAATPPSILLVDQADDEDRVAFDRKLDAAVSTMPPEIVIDLSAYHCRVYTNTDPGAIYFARPYSQRQCPDSPTALAADMIGAITDLVEVRVIQAPGGTQVANRSRQTSLGLALSGFLTARAGAAWGMHSYTGSVVSTMIAELEELAAANGNPVLRSPSEHGLACAAMGRWILDTAPFLIVVTSGMTDEFKGTLSNLRTARAKGFLVCADTSGNYWFPFQGTIHQEENSLAVLNSRGFRTIYLSRLESLATDLVAAFEAYDNDEGPVVLVATPAVLEMTEPLDIDLARSYRTSAPAQATIRTTDFEQVLHILNEEPVRLLWQCGTLNPEEAELVHDLARRSGAALCDSVTRPGSVSKYHDGRLVPEYLGTLGLYGTSSRVHSYLYADGKPLAADRLCLFFLKSRVAQVATPFTERILQKRMRVVQVTNEHRHFAPFTHHRICADLISFLRAVSDELAVQPAILERRRAALREAAEISDTVSTFPSLPMSPNFFFSRLNALLERMIERHGYTYTGVFDAGRGAVSAIRNLARTGPGFSGIYGRGLMGDALMAVPAIALSADRNVLAFVGDGAAALVPDILPSIIQRVYLEGCAFRRNLSIFRLCNGGHSLIRTYREVRRGLAADMQMTLINRIPPDATEVFGSALTLRTRRLFTFDDEVLAEQLREERTINHYSVILNHNNDGDSVGAQSANSWQTAPLRVCS